MFLGVIVSFLAGNHDRNLMFLKSKLFLPLHLVNAFFYFGAKIDSESQPKAKFELSSGDWIGPWNLILAQESVPVGPNSTLVDRYVARYVQSRSMMPSFLQNKLPFESTLYTKPDDYAAFLGSSALKYMTQSQTNYSVATNDTSIDDPYASHLQTCDNGNVQPILPLLELTFTDPNANSTKSQMTNSDDGDDNLQMSFKVQYKMMAVPTLDEPAYRVLPHLQSKFQGKGNFNILGGPYCYGDDPMRGYSFDLLLDSQHNSSGVSFVRGCLPGYPCVPPTAMGGIPMVTPNNSCSHKDHDHDKPKPDTDGGAPNVALAIVSYALGVALVISLTLHFQAIGQQRKKETTISLQRDEEGTAMFRLLENENNSADVELDQSKPSYFGDKNLLEGVGIPGATSSDHREEVNPFGDLAPAEEGKVDPLQEPLLTSKD